MKTQILFVDDEPNVLSGLRRMLRSERSKWSMHFAGSGEEALAMLDQQPMDVIVSDMRMPGIDGAELLRRVADRYPDTIRLVLSGQSSHERIFRAVGPAHQFLSKPCESDVLVDTVRRTCQLRSHLNHESLHKVVAQIESLPPLPRLYQELVEILESDDASLDRVGDIIGGDLAMSVKVLQWVNSSFFGLPQHVTCPKHAVSLLGLGVIRPLTLTVGAFGHYQDIDSDVFSHDEAIAHGLAVATTARQIAADQVAADSSLDPHMVDDAFIAGMMHDIGKLILASSFPQQYQDVLRIVHEKKVSSWEAEREVFETTHAEVGAHLLGLWGMPHSIIEATALHHEPSLGTGRQFAPLTAVHAADALRGPLVSDTPDWDEAYFQAVGLVDQPDQWTRQTREEVSQ